MIAGLTEELPPAPRLALAYAPVRTRALLLPLLALDGRLAAILRKRREVVLVQVRLAWWRDLLAQPVAQWPKGDQLLDGLARWRDPAALVPLVDGWESLLADDLTPGMIADFSNGRAQAFAALAQELGAGDPAAADAAGRVWALADLAANLSDAEERQSVVEHALSLPVPPRLPRSLRPLAVLATLGRHALEQGSGPLLSGPKSAWLALRSGWLGR